MKKKEVREVKGWIYKGFLEKGWRGNDHAVFLYRKMTKSETHTFSPVTVKITTLSPKKKPTK